MQNFIKIFIKGLKVLIALFLRFLQRILGFWIGVLNRNQRYLEKDLCCINPPPEIRARTDPYVYSQQWLWLRGIAFVWDNPDFTIIDKSTGLVVNNYSLVGNHDYLVQVLIHNASMMTAFGTKVEFQVLEFGASGTVVASLGTVTLDVPGGGSKLVEIPWHTPPSGHNCLQAIISHVDDANPLNNVGQHNTSIAEGNNTTKMIKFIVNNSSKEAKNIELKMNAYKLPKEPMRAQNEGERRSLKYLRRLQAINNVLEFPIPDFLNAKLSHTQFELGPQARQEITVELTEPSLGIERIGININAIAIKPSFDTTKIGTNNIIERDELLGGITVYIGKED